MHAEAGVSPTEPKLKRKTLLYVGVFFICAFIYFGHAHSASATAYYGKTGVSPHLTTSWGTTAGVCTGAGSQPGGFTTAGDTFTIESCASMTASAVWVVGSAAATSTTSTLTINTGGTLAMSTFLLTLASTNFVNNGTYSGSGGVTISGTGTTISIGGFTTTGIVSMTKTAGTATFTAAGSTTGNVGGSGFTMNGNGGTLNLGTSLTHTFSSTWIRTNGILNGGSSTLKLGASASGTGGTFTASTGTVEYTLITGSANIAGVTYNNLKLDNTSGSFTALADILVNGTLTTTAGGTLDMSTFALTLGGSSTISNSGIIKTSNTTSTPIPTGKTWGGTISYGVLAGGQTVVTATYNNLTVLNTSGTDTAGGTLTVNGALTTTSGGTLAMSTFQLLGTVTPTHNGTLTTSNTTNPAIPSGKTWTGTTGLVTFGLSTGGQSVPAGTYKGLTFSNTSGTNTAVGNLTVNGTLTTTSGGTLDMTSSYTLAGTITSSNAGTIKTGVLTSTSATPIPSGITWTGSGTVEYTATTGAQTIMLATYSGTLQLDNTSGTNTASGAITVTTALNTTTGGTFDMSTFALTVGGSVTITNNGTLKISNTGATPITSAKTWGGTGTVEYAAAGQTVMTGTYNNLTLSGSGTDTATAAITTTGNFTISGSVIFAGSTYTHVIAGNWVIDSSAGSSPYTCSTTGAVSMNTPSSPAGTTLGGTTTQTITFCDLNINNTSGVTVNENVSFSTGTTPTLTIGTGATLTPATGAVISGTGTLTGTGTAQVSANSSDAFLTQYTVTTKTLTSLVINYNGGASQLISNTTYPAGLSVSGSISTGANSATVGTGFATSGTFTPTSGTITMNNGSAILNLGTMTFANLTIASGATVTANTSFSINGTLTNSSTAVLTSNTGTITCSGCTITNSGTTLTFNNLTTSGTVAAGSSNFTVSGDFVASSGGTFSGTGNIIVNGGDVTGDGAITMTGGTFLLDGTGNFGGNNGTGWTFYNLTFGDGSGAATSTATGSCPITVSAAMTIAANQTLDAGSKTWNLNGSSSSSTTDISDTFTGTNGTTVNAHTPDVGGAWANGSATITSNTAVQGAFSQGRESNATVPSSADYSVSADVIFNGATATGNFASVIGRFNVAGSNFYELYYSGTAAAWKLSKFASGVETNLGTYGMAYTQGQTHTAKLTMIGTAITGFIDGISQISVTDATWSAVGVSGFRLEDGSANVALRIDNFSVTEGIAVNPLTVNGTFTGNTSTVIFKGTSATTIPALAGASSYKHLSFQPPSGSPTYTLGTATGQTFTVNGTMTVGDGSHAVTVTAAAYNPALILLGDLTINASAVFSKAGASGSFGHSRTITIDHTKVPNTDLTNFPVVINGTYSYLATVGNGGKVINASGYDIGFYTNSDCTTGKMAWETQSYNASTGAVIYWINVASVSHVTDTVFYMCYGNSNISIDQSTPTSVWDANFNAVWHLPNGTVLSGSDSTINGKTATITGVTATSGQVDGAASFGGTYGNDLTVATMPTVTTFTIEAWAKFTDFSLYRGVIFKGTNANRNYEMDGRQTSGRINVEYTTGGVFHSVTGATSLNPGVFYHIVGTFDGTTETVYVNGVSDGTTSTSATPDSTDALNIGQIPDGSNVMSGALDEVRISSVARSADWIKTEYNNQSSPSSFYAVGLDAADSGIVTFAKGGTQTWTDNTSGQDLGAVQIAGGGYARSMTVDHTKVPNTDQTNFPVVVTGTYTYLKTVANGGKVQSSNGYDIRFTSDSGCTTLLKFERVNWDATTGTVEFWVKIPTLATATDTVFYMCYGDSTFTTDQQDRANTWNSSYKAVYHLKDGTTLAATDSTSSGYDGTITGATATAGQVDGGGSFSGTDMIGRTGVLTLPAFSASFWVYGNQAAAGAGSNTYTKVFSKFGVADPVNPAIAFNWTHQANSNRACELYLGSSVWQMAQLTTTLAANTWYNIACTYDGTTLHAYLNGNQEAQTGIVGVLTGSGPLNLAGTVTGDFAGKIDEFQLSDSMRGADWIKTEYNNQLSPSTFYTVGSETTVGSTTTLNLGSSVKATTMTINATQTFSSNGTRTLTLTGNSWTNNGTFTASTGTVTFAPATVAAPVVIAGSSATTFNNFTDATAGTTIQFKASQSTGFSGTLTITGTPSSPIWITSDTASTKWNLALSGSASITFANIKDSGCAGGTNTITLNDTVVDRGNNTSSCWVFVGRGGGAVGTGGNGGASGGGSGSSGGGQSENNNGNGGSSGGGGGVLPQAFTGSNSTALTTYDSSWALLSGNFAINTNSVYSNTAATDTMAAWNVGSFNANQYAQLTLTVLSSGNYMGVAVRTQNGAQSGYGSYSDSNTAVKIIRWDAGTPTVLYTGSAFTAGDVLRLEISGTTLTLKQNSNTVTTVVDSQFSSGKPGLIGKGNATTSRGDDWYADSLASQGGGGGGGGGSP